VLAEIPKNKSEIPRVGLSEFKGHNLAYARVFYEGEDGKLLPTKKGVTFKLWMLPALFEALQRTEDEARKAGLLTDKAA